MIAVIMITFTVFGLTVFEAKTKIMRLHTRGVSTPPPSSASTPPAKCTKKYTILHTSTLICSSKLTGAYVTPGAASESIPSKRASSRHENPDTESLTTGHNAVQLRHVASTRVPLRRAASDSQSIFVMITRFPTSKSP